MNQALCRDGVQVTVGTKITEVATRGALKIVRYTDPAGQPDVEGLGLEDRVVEVPARITWCWAVPELAANVADPA